MLEGFTITAGSGRIFFPSLQRGGGIYCQNASPTIRSNLITQNFVGSAGIYGTANAEGGGVYVASGAPLIIGNFITGNTVVTRGSPGAGGGVFLAGGNPILVNNVINANGICASCRINPISGGSGVEVTGAATLISNTIVNNGSGSGNLPRHGGLIAGPSCAVFNCIIRDNDRTEIRGNPVVVHSDVKGGFPGPGNFDVDPAFVDKVHYRLSWQSPCVDRGTSVVPLPAFDYEGDLRVSGVAVDVGADETHPHVSLTGAPQRGRNVSIVVWGPPGAAATLGTAARSLAPPIPIPGAGNLWIDPASARLTPLPNLDTRGRIELKIVVPTTTPLVTIALQSLVGGTLTNPIEVQILP